MLFTVKPCHKATALYPLQGNSFRYKFISWPYNWSKAIPPFHYYATWWFLWQNGPKGKTQRVRRNSANSSLACLPKTSPLATKTMRGPACPVTFLSLTAAVSWPCKGSAITSLLIEGPYEWLDEGSAVSLPQSMKLISPCRNGDTHTRREDPMKL